ncbi:hypothetical protein AKO1_009370 [Acrasis kona]|uniref:Uncharacterized protein n=1 Tax=Acrasis kona TaxID=1008807 RepID=A0AAW2ZL73_9EUKA
MNSILDEMGLTETMSSDEEDEEEQPAPTYQAMNWSREPISTSAKDETVKQDTTTADIQVKNIGAQDDTTTKQDGILPTPNIPTIDAPQYNHRACYSYILFDRKAKDNDDYEHDLVICYRPPGSTKTTTQQTSNTLPFRSHKRRIKRRKHRENRQGSSRDSSRGSSYK